MANRIKGGQKLVGPPKKPTKASRATARKHLGYGLKIYGLAADPTGFIVRKATKPLKEKLANKIRKRFIGSRNK
jgi:hypothetical protein